MKEGILARDRKGKPRLCPKCKSNLVIISQSQNYKVVCSVCSYQEPCHLRHVKVSKSNCSKCAYSPYFEGVKISELISSYIREKKKQRRNKIKIREEDLREIILGEIKRRYKLKYPKLFRKCPQAWNPHSVNAPILSSFS